LAKVKRGVRGWSRGVKRAAVRALAYVRIAWDPEARQWYDGLSNMDAERLAPALDEVSRHGKGSAKAFVKQIKSSDYPEMHEIRSSGGNLRILFAFDSRGTAMMLRGGDKTGIWNQWYLDNVPVADGRYRDHLRTIGKEAACRITTVGRRSAGLER
jgi:hypothetical protein